MALAILNKNHTNHYNLDQKLSEEIKTRQFSVFLSYVNKSINQNTKIPSNIKHIEINIVEFIFNNSVDANGKFTDINKYDISCNHKKQKLPEIIKRNHPNVFKSEQEIINLMTNKTVGLFKGFILSTVNIFKESSTVNAMKEKTAEVYNRLEKTIEFYNIDGINPGNIKNILFKRQIDYAINGCLINKDSFCNTIFKDQYTNLNNTNTINFTGQVINKKSSTQLFLCNVKKIVEEIQQDLCIKYNVKNKALINLKVWIDSINITFSPSGFLSLTEGKNFDSESGGYWLRNILFKLIETIVILSGGVPPTLRKDNVKEYLLEAVGLKKNQIDAKEKNRGILFEFIMEKLEGVLRLYFFPKKELGSKKINNTYFFQQIGNLITSGKLIQKDFSDKEEKCIEFFYKTKSIIIGYSGKYHKRDIERVGGCYSLEIFSDYKVYKKYDKYNTEFEIQKWIILNMIDMLEEIHSTKGGNFLLQSLKAFSESSL